MTDELYALFKATKPRLKSYSRGGVKAKVSIGFSCLKEHRGDLEKFAKEYKNCKKGIVKISRKTKEVIYFTVVCEDYELTDLIVADLHLFK